MVIFAFGRQRDMGAATIEERSGLDVRAQPGGVLVADFSPEERDCLLQITADAIDVAIMNTLATELCVPHDEARRTDILERQGAAWDRIASDADLLVRVIDSFETAELERLMAESGAPAEAASKFFAIAHREGGIRPMLEQRVTDVLNSPWPTVRIRLHWHDSGVRPITDADLDADFDATFDLDEGAMMCAAGALAITGGAGLVATGGGTLATFALVVGVVIVADSS